MRARRFGAGGTAYTRVEAARPRKPFAAHWFQAWLWLFAMAIAASLGVITLGFVEQMRVLGEMTLGAAVAGALVCLLGLRLYHPRGWGLVRGQVAGVRDSARSATRALAEPRHALADAHHALPR